MRTAASGRTRFKNRMVREGSHNLSDAGANRTVGIELRTKNLAWPQAAALNPLVELLP
jgi:hypothetical protein